MSLQRFCDYKKNCEKSNKLFHENEKNSTLYCPGEFDGLLCWPHANLDSMVTAYCPQLLDGDNDALPAYRFCTENGTWYMGDVGTVFPGHQCNFELLQRDLNNNEKTFMKSHKQLTIAYAVFCSISVFCLVIAVVLLGFFKKLHCVRNYIHLSLMTSFILHYLTVLIQSHMIKAPEDLNGVEQDIWSYCTDDDNKLTSCRIIMTLLHYSLLANCFWLLVEGVYLHMLLVFPLAENKHFSAFMVFAWGAPLLPVGVWFGRQLVWNRTKCWDILDESSIPTRVLVSVSIVINFIIFVNLIRIVASKLRAHHMSKNDNKYKTARSTLTLIPLLGVHYIIFLAVTKETVGTDNTALLVKFFFEYLTHSIQGAFIALFYCFLNEEVQMEILKAWKNIKNMKQIPEHSNRKRSEIGSIPDVRILSAKFNGNTSSNVTFTVSFDCGKSKLTNQKSAGDDGANSGVSQQLLMENSNNNNNTYT